MKSGDSECSGNNVMEEFGCHISEAVEHIRVINSYHSKTLYDGASWLFPPPPSLYYPSLPSPYQINSFNCSLFLVLTIMIMKRRASVCVSVFLT